MIPVTLWRGLNRNAAQGKAHSLSTVLTKLAGKQGDGRRRRVSLGLNGERLEMVLISRPKSGLSARELRVSVVPPSKAPKDPTIST